MSPEKLRVGVIGANASYGWSPRAIIPALLALPECELTAVCTAHPETAKESAEAFGARLAFHDYHDMLARQEIDAVVIAVRVPKHHGITMDVLRAGKHVYTEWPLAVDVRQGQEMANLARAMGVHHMVGLQMRAAPGWLRVKELIEEGYVGDVLTCHMAYLETARFQHPAGRLYHADRAQGVNTLTVTFGHAVDIFCHCLGDFTELSAVVSTQVKRWCTTDTLELVDVTAPDHILVSGRLEGGAVATVYTAAVPHHATGIRLEVHGTEGTLVATTPTRSVERLLLLGGQGHNGQLAELPIPDRLDAAPEARERGAGGPALHVAYMLHRFAEAVRTGQRAEPDFSTGVCRLALIAAVERSSEQSRREVLVTTG